MLMFSKTKKIASTFDLYNQHSNITVVGPLLVTQKTIVNIKFKPVKILIVGGNFLLLKLLIIGFNFGKFKIMIVCFVI